MAAPVYIFKVALKEAKRIWRRIAIRGNQTLKGLHKAIYVAFDREEEHLYSFYIFRAGDKGRARMNNAIEYAHPFILEDHPFSDGAVLDASKTKIDQLKLMPGQKFEYIFDFGDSWWHEITVEETNGQLEKGKYPRILERRGESPPQYQEYDEGTR